jgi:hypothetical protein
VDRARRTMFYELGGAITARDLNLGGCGVGHVGGVETESSVFPLPVIALPVAAKAATVTALPRGWAHPVARDKDVLDDVAVRFITQWFEEGAAGRGKARCSAATALQRLRMLKTALPSAMGKNDMG